MKFPNLPRSLVRPSTLHALVSALAVVALVLFSTPARAQIKEPGAHNDYVVELEPHFVFQPYSYGYGYYYGAGEGIGVGMRATIPFFKNGPIDKINNNMGIGFGVDWVHNGNACSGPFYYNGRFFNAYYAYDCSWDVFHFPVVVQWNFFLTPIISVFGEAGIAIRHFSGRINYPAGYYCVPGDPYCDYSYTDIEPAFFGGARFQFGKGSIVSAIIRIGYPYFSAGIGIMI